MRAETLQVYHHSALLEVSSVIYLIEEGQKVILPVLQLKGYTFKYTDKVLVHTGFLE